MLSGLAAVTGAVGLAVVAQWHHGSSPARRPAAVAAGLPPGADPTTIASSTTSIAGGAPTSNPPRQSSAAYGSVAPRSPAFVPSTAGPVASSVVTMAPVCRASEVCLNVLGDRLLGPEVHVAQGFIHGVDSSTSPALVAALQPRQWVLADNGDDAQQAQLAGASTTFLLDVAWDAETAPTNHGQPLAPWEHLDQYAAFVKREVTTVEASGQRIGYWQIQNEPDAPITPGGESASTSQALDVFQTGVDGIRSVDPRARIVGPALAAFNDQPSTSTRLDMVTFLDYVVAHNIRIDALSWHEVGKAANPVDLFPDPSSVVIHVQRLRQLLAERPSVGRPAIIINEYDSVADHLIPGWAVAWIDALEQAGIDQANRSCWHQPDVYGKMVSECTEGSVDGLFVPGSGLPEAIYNVHRAYAQMTGTRLVTSSTSPGVSLVASRDDGAGRLTVLVGRHESCTAAVRVDCNEPASATPGPAAVLLVVQTPWTVSSVDVQRVANIAGVAPVPQTVSHSSVGRGGSLGIPIPAFADGDAYVITLTR